jgi:hypothetical protein
MLSLTDWAEPGSLAEDRSSGSDIPAPVPTFCVFSERADDNALASDVCTCAPDTDWPSAADKNDQISTLFLAEHPKMPANYPQNSWW